MIRLVLIFIITTLMVFSAHAQERHFDPGGGGGGWSGQRHFGGPVYHPSYYGHRDAAGALVGGILGGWLWRQFNEPAPVVVQAPAGPTVEWCISRYKSYDPERRVYLGFDGVYHACP
jgi:hypothetical protein